MSIPRWRPTDQMTPVADGDSGGYVTYADHVAAIAEATRRGERVSKTWIVCALCGHVINVGNKAAGRGLMRTHLWLHSRGYFGGTK